jgi:leucyl aminopeptidase (aminopeptidase T)
MDDRLEALAELAVRFGANVQPGQIVAVGSEPGKEPLARAVAEAAYRRGAKFVDPGVLPSTRTRQRSCTCQRGSISWDTTSADTVRSC